MGIVLAEQPIEPTVETKPLLARVRTDGPLLPPLQLPNRLAVVMDASVASIR